MSHPAPTLAPPTDLPLRPLLAPVAAIAFAYALRVALDAAPAIVSAALMSPAAIAASILTGSELVRDPVDGFWILLASIGTPQKVTFACSGVGCFSMLAALLLWRAIDGGAATARRLWLPALLLYPIAVAANGCRIALSAPVSVLAASWLGPNYQAMAHLALGCLVFLSALIAFNLLICHATRHRDSH